MAIEDELIWYTEKQTITGVRLANFRNDSDEPLESHKTWIKQQFLPMMAKNPGARVRLTGMASRNGDATYNMSLSTRRIAKIEALLGGQVKIVERNSRGELEAEEDGYKDGNRSGRYRAVLLRWEGLSGPVPVPPGPSPGPPKFKKVVIKADPGVWLIIGVDAFGLPFPIVTAGKIVVTLLNDKGEQWAITGFGAGPSVGKELPVIKDLKFITKFLVDLGLKLGDIPFIFTSVIRYATALASAPTFPIPRAE